MIREPTAMRKAKHPNGPGRPRMHPATVRGGCPQGAIAAEGLQIAMPVRPCPGWSAVPACTADASFREQDRAEMVKCIGRCPDRTDNCTATTLGVVSLQTE